MSAESEVDDSKPTTTVKHGELMEAFAKDVQELQSFIDLFFEQHPLEMAPKKMPAIMKKRETIINKYDTIDEANLSAQERANYLYLKGRLYNIVSMYDPRALECLSKAVKLDPTMVVAWNELGECYWKNYNITEAKICFEAGLNQKRDRVTLRSLSILLRQETNTDIEKLIGEDIMTKSVDYAKEAVALDPKDGISWSVLGNAYLCQYFLVAQNPATLRLSLGAYKQAWLDPIAKGHPDLHYNKGMALKYDERYSEAIESFTMAIKVDPPWGPPIQELKELVGYLNCIDHMIKNKGKIKAKRLHQMVKSMEQSMFVDYEPGALVTLNKKKVALQHAKLAELVDGENAGKVVLGRVVGSLHSNNNVPFTFAMVDESMCCVAVSVYNWADGRGVLIGDCVALPEPTLATHTYNEPCPKEIANENFFGSKEINEGKKTNLTFDFRSIRVNDPTTLRVNGKRIGRDEFACTRVTSTYESH